MHAAMTTTEHLVNERQRALTSAASRARRRHEATTDSVVAAATPGTRSRFAMFRRSTAPIRTGDCAVA
jgi:hypothetical protein